MLWLKCTSTIEIRYVSQIYARYPASLKVRSLYARSQLLDIINRLQNAPENSSSNKTSPASKLGNSAGIALGNGASRSLVEVPSTNVGELALLGQESGIGSNLNTRVSKKSRKS